MSLQGSQSQLRVGVSDPPCGCEAKRTSAACLRNQPEGPGPVGQGPNTLHRSLAMELRRQWASPAGCRGQLRLAISGRNGRSGARVDAHRQSPTRKRGGWHWTTPRRIPTRPAPSQGGTELKHPAGPRPCEGGRASRRVHLDAPSPISPGRPKVHFAPLNAPYEEACESPQVRRRSFTLVFERVPASTCFTITAQ